MPAALGSAAGYAVIALVPVRRPDGRWYRPRKVVAQAWEDDDRDIDPRRGAVVLGTHDVQEATSLAQYACGVWYGSAVVESPVVGWFRRGYVAGRQGDPCWIQDPKRGRAGVMFTSVWD